MSLEVRPQAWCTPIGLFAVIGPSINDHFLGDDWLRWRYFSTISCSCHQRRISRSKAGKSTLVGTGLNIRFSPTKKPAPLGTGLVLPAVPPQFLDGRGARWGTYSCPRL